jgi:hypothetical protein
MPQPAEHASRASVVSTAQRTNGLLVDGQCTGEDAVPSIRAFHCSYLPSRQYQAHRPSRRVTALPSNDDAAMSGFPSAFTSWTVML